MADLLDKNINDHHQHHQNQGCYHRYKTHRVAVGNYRHTVFYDCTEIGKDVSCGVLDLYKNRVILREKQNDEDGQTFSRGNDNYSENNRISNKKTDTSHGGNKNSMSSDLRIKSSIKNKLSTLNVYTIIKTTRGVRFQSRMSSENMFARGALNKHAFIGLKPGNKLVNEVENCRLQSKGGDHTTANKYSEEDTQSSHARKDSYERLSTKIFNLSCNVNYRSGETSKKTPPNSNCNKVKCDNTNSSCSMDPIAKNETTRKNSNKNDTNPEAKKFNCVRCTDALGRGKQKLQRQMQHYCVCDKHRRQNRNTCTQITADQMLTVNDLQKNYCHLGAFKDYPREGNIAMFDNVDNTTRVTTKVAAMTLGGIEQHKQRRTKYTQSTVDRNQNSKPVLSRGVSGRIFSIIGIDWLISPDNPLAEPSERRVTHKHVHSDSRLDLLITWNLLQLIFIIVAFLWASLCICHFKKYISEPRKCVRYQVQTPASEKSRFFF